MWSILQSLITAASMRGFGWDGASSVPCFISNAVAIRKSVLQSKQLRTMEQQKVGFPCMRVRREGGKIIKRESEHKHQLREQFWCSGIGLRTSGL